jgi:hypothetical protein
MTEYISTGSAKLQPPPYPESNVPLHVLCDHCRAIKLQDRLESTWQYEVQDRARDLIARAETCHLCMVLLTLLDPSRSTNKTREGEPTSTVRFDAWRRSALGPPWDMGKKIIEVRVTTRMFYNTSSIANFVLVPYSCTSRTATLRQKRS